MIQFRPTLWMSVLLVPALLILGGLGVWQLQRLQWKNQLIAQQQTGQDAPAVPLETVLGDGQAVPMNVAWKRVSVQGRYVKEAPVRRLFRTHDGVPGFRLLTLFESDQGLKIFVDRGFAPQEQTSSEVPKNELSLIGFLHPAGEKGWMTPEPEIKNNIWYWRDIISMVPKNVRPPFVVEYVLDLEKSDGPQTWPQAVGAPPTPVNNHLDYAFTWFGLGFALLGVYLVWHVKNGRLQFGRGS